MAHKAMVGLGSPPVIAAPFAPATSIASPPRVAQRCGMPSASSPDKTSTSRNFNGVWRFFPRHGVAGVQHLRDLRSVSTNSMQSRHFNMSFDPSKSNIPIEYNFTKPMSAAVGAPAEVTAPAGQEKAVVDMGPYVEFDPNFGHPNDTYWRHAAPTGSFMIGNAFAQRTRLTPLRVPELGATGPHNPFARILSPFPREEYYAVEMELNYGKEWPRFVWENGTFVFRPGFLQPTVDPDFPAYWLHRGIARFQLSAADQVAQTVIAAVYLAALAALASVLYTIQPMLLAAVAVSWARNTLSLAKWALLLGLVAADRLYLYWLFLAGKIVDGVLASHVPPVRNFCWANLVLWGGYLLFSPADASLLPGIVR